MLDMMVPQPGDTIENRVTGERIVFRETSSQNGGARVVFDTFVKPHGFVAAAHVHPYQVEHFTVVSGHLGIRLGARRIELLSGDSVTVPKGIVHRFWNAGDEIVHFRSEITPALHFESLLMTMFALAQDGKTNRKGMPNPFRLAVVAQAHFDTVRLPFPPQLVQRLALAAGAPLGRALGYEPTYGLQTAGRIAA